MRQAFKIGTAGLSAIALLSVWGQARAEDRPSLNLYGRPGLVDVPTAQVLKDGDLAVTFGAFPGQNRSTLTFQITPRLTGSLRYARISDFFGPDDSLFDRSFDLSYLILTETKNRPALSIGLRDFIGTGFYGAEYVVATKSFGEKLTLTGGLGWGRLGSRGGIGSPFGDRPAVEIGEGGRLTDDQWFRGDVAPFGGVEYRFNDKFSATVEYSSDAYTREENRDLFDQASPINLGLRYSFDHGGTLSAYYLYGNTVGVSYSLALNPKEPAAPTGFEAAPLPVNPRPSRRADPEAYETDWVADDTQIARGKSAIADALAKDGQILDAISLTPTRVQVTVRNRRFAAHPQGLGRTARVLSRALPASVETFEITLTDSAGVPSTTVSLTRSDIERLEFAGSDALLPQVSFADSVGRVSEEPIASEHDRLTWSLEPGISVSLFDPDAPVRGDVTLELNGSYELRPGLTAAGTVSATVFGTLDQIEELGPSALPRVRSDIGLFKGNPRITSAYLGWNARPGENLYSRVTGGLLETQFGGVAGELLWSPVDSRLALGAEVAYARRRDFDGAFGLADFDVVTGHASAYYDFGGGYLGQVDVGRYLAGDLGATLTLSREFDNGWVVGAFATRTDVSFEDFGEGSFDRGILLTIPFEWATGKPSRNRTSLGLRSLSRDGGARLIVPGRLYEGVRETRQRELSDRWGRFWR